MNLSKFRAGRTWSDNPERDAPGHGYGDGDNLPGYLYHAGALYIQRCNSNPDGLEFHVELFGADHVGTLADCEAELWHAATVEGVLGGAPLTVSKASKNRVNASHAVEADANRCRVMIDMLTERLATYEAHAGKLKATWGQAGDVSLIREKLLELVSNDDNREAVADEIDNELEALAECKS